MVLEANEGGGRNHYSVLVILGVLWSLVWQDRKSHLYLRSWCYLRKWGYGVSQTLSLFSHFQQPFNIREFMEEIFANEDIKHMDLCDFTQDTSPTLAPSKNHWLHSTRSSLLQITQLRMKATFKGRIQFQHPRPHNITSMPSTVKLKCKDPLQITKFSN